MMESLRSELVSSNIGVSVFCPAYVYSNIGRSERNRPPTLKEVGTPDREQQEVIEAFGRGMREAILKNLGSQHMMEALEAGRRVLEGIRNNDLYIISHPEYRQALRGRCDAILASVSNEGIPVPEARVAIGRLSRNSIYTKEIKRKSTSAGDETSHG
jgi:hypothetical protein